jgi:hypothetical protein
LKPCITLTVVGTKKGIYKRPRTNILSGLVFFGGGRSPEYPSLCRPVIYSQVVLDGLINPILFLITFYPVVIWHFLLVTFYYFVRNVRLSLVYYTSFLICYSILHNQYSFSPNIRKLQYVMDAYNLYNSPHLSDKLELTQSHFGKVQAHERKAM